MSPKIVNLTPHEINLIVGGKEIIIPKGDTPAIRLKEEWTHLGEVDGIPLVSCKYTSDVALPPIIEGTIYITSAIVANAFPERTDFVIPAQGLRDEDGRIYARQSLALVNVNSECLYMCSGNSILERKR